MLILPTLLLLQIKHFVFDWWFQTAEEVEHKGIFLDPKGITHSLKHGIGTAACLCLARTLPGAGISPEAIIQLSLLDLSVHYTLDWSKQNISSSLSLTPSGKGFWVLMGLDQLLHQLTYLLLVYLAVS